MMDCLVCKSPIDSFELETYDCTYDELTQAVGSNCLSCSFVFECIRTGAADIRSSEIIKIDVLRDYYCELHLETRLISLDIFTETGQCLKPLFCLGTPSNLLLGKVQNNF